MVIYKCDKCKKEVDNIRHLNLIQIIVREYDDTIDHPTWEIDMCEDCTNKLLKEYFE